MGVGVPDTQGQLTSQSLCRIVPNFELNRELMVVLIACKNEEDPIKNEGNRDFNTFPHRPYLESAIF